MQNRVLSNYERALESRLLYEALEKTSSTDGLRETEPGILVASNRRDAAMVGGGRDREPRQNDERTSIRQHRAGRKDTHNEVTAALCFRWIEGTGLPYGVYFHRVTPKLAYPTLSCH